MAPDMIIEPLEAALLEMLIELGEAGKGRDRHQEIASHIADQALDFAFVIALAGPAEAVEEQIVRLQLGSKRCGAITVIGGLTTSSISGGIARRSRRGRVV